MTEYEQRIRKMLMRYSQNLRRIGTLKKLIFQLENLPLAEDKRWSDFQEEMLKEYRIELSDLKAQV